MTEEYQHEEVSSAVVLGLLASDMVIAVAKLLRSAVLAASERQTLERGSLLLEALSTPLDNIPASEGLSNLGSKNSALDALQAMQVRAPGEDIRAFVQPLAEGLRAVLEGKPPSDHENELKLIADLFTSIGDVEVSRVSGLSQPTPDSPPWVTSPATSPS